MSDINSSSIDTLLQSDSVSPSSSMPPSPTISSPSSPSSSSSVDDSHQTAKTAVAEGMPTTKHGRNPYSPPSRTWIGWFCDKYTIQYAFPPTYAPAVLQISNTVFPLGILFGLCLPRTLAFLYNTLTLNTTAWLQADAATKWYQYPQLHIYLLSWVVFHMLEFMVTASYNPTRLFSDSFLLNNGIHYHIAHAVALVEYSLTAYLYPSTKVPSAWTYVGLGLIIGGQFLRSLAMIHASNNFSHILAFQKRQDHRLVKEGVYAWTRHPSYVGFTYWALGTQVMLGNKLGLVGFGATLWLFFSRRIRAEERALVEFFGDEYIEYRKKVGTGLPFIR